MSGLQALLVPRSPCFFIHYFPCHHDRSDAPSTTLLPLPKQAFSAHTVVFPGKNGAYLRTPMHDTHLRWLVDRFRDFTSELTIMDDG